MTTFWMSYHYITLSTLAVNSWCRLSDSHRYNQHLSHSDARGTYVIGPILEASFTCKLLECAYFYMERISPKGEVIKIPCNPPSTPVKAVLENRYHKGVRHLAGIVEAPYLDNYGDIVGPGYNNANGTIYIETVQVPALPGSQGQADAKQQQTVYWIWYANSPLLVRMIKSHG